MKQWISLTLIIFSLNAFSQIDDESTFDPTSIINLSYELPSDVDTFYFELGKLISSDLNPGDEVVLSNIDTFPTLLFEEYKYSSNGRWIHFIGHAIDEESGSARITIDSRSIFSEINGEKQTTSISGKISYQGKNIRLRSDSDPKKVIFYDEKNLKIIDKSKKEKLSKADKKSRYIEAIGNQFDFVSSLNHGDYIIGVTGTITVLNENAITAIFKNKVKDKKNADKLVNKIKGYLPLVNHEELTHKESRKSGDGFLHIYHQSIHGIPVYPSAIKIFTDDEGNVSRVHTGVRQDLGVTEDPNLSPKDLIPYVEEFANNNLNYLNRLNISEDSILISDIRYIPSGEDLQLVYYVYVPYLDGLGEVDLLVNLDSGQTKEHDLYYGTIGVKICNGVNSTLGWCHEPQTRLSVIMINDQCQNNNSLRTTSKVSVLNQTAKDVFDMWEVL